MEEFRKTLREAIEVLRRKPAGTPINAALDSAYNKALDDVVEQIINRIPN